MSLLKEFTNVQSILKQSNRSDAGASDVTDKAVSSGDVSFSLMRNTINSAGEVNGSDVADYLDKAEDLNDEVDTVPFGLETDNGQIVKVYVNAEQADAFEEAMKNMLGLEDDIEEAVNRLSTEFDIVDVVWPAGGDDEGAGGDPAEVDPDADLSIDDFSNLEDDDEFADEDAYDVIAGDDTKKAKADATVDADDAPDDTDTPDEDADADDDSDSDDKDDADSDDADSDEDDEDLDDDGKPKKKKKKAKPAEPADESLNSEKHMTIGSSFLKRVLQEAAPEDTDSIKDGFNIPLDSQARALSAKLRLPMAKRLVAMHFMVGIPGRFLNSEDAESTIAGAADMLRKKVSVRRAFLEFYDGLANAKGYSIPAGDVKEEKISEASKNKRGGFMQRLLESVLVELGLPGALIAAGGPSAVGTGIYQTADMVENDSTLQRSLRVLATRLGVKMTEVNDKVDVEESVQGFKVGDSVVNKAYKSKGVVKSYKNGKYEVKFGGDTISMFAKDMSKAVGIKEENLEEALTEPQAVEKLGNRGPEFIEILHDKDNGHENATVSMVAKDDNGKKWTLTRTGKYQAYKYTLKPVKENLEEAVDVGNDAFAEAIMTLVSALGIPDAALQQRKSQVIASIRQKKATLRNRAQLITMMGRLSALVEKNTIQAGSNQQADADDEQ